jgi:Circularly permutated YpsA SLOG family
MPIDPSKMTIMKIVSGGQTGVDRGALDAALTAEFPCGGWCPEGRQSEDGRIPDKYPLLVLAGSSYRQRTLKNVQDSDGTLILFTASLTGGTKLTRDFCLRERKPFLLVDAARVSVTDATAGVATFIMEKNIRVLNVAGPRASGWERGHTFAFDVIAGVMGSYDGDERSHCVVELTPRSSNLASSR